MKLHWVMPIWYCMCIVSSADSRDISDDSIFTLKESLQNIFNSLPYSYKIRTYLCLNLYLHTNVTNTCFSRISFSVWWINRCRTRTKFGRWCLGRCECGRPIRSWHSVKCTAIRRIYRFSLHGAYEMWKVESGEWKVGEQWVGGWRLFAQPPHVDHKKKHSVVP